MYYKLLNSKLKCLYNAEMSKCNRFTNTSFEKYQHFIINNLNFEHKKHDYIVALNDKMKNDNSNTLLFMRHQY